MLSSLVGFVMAAWTGWLLLNASRGDLGKYKNGIEMSNTISAFEFGSQHDISTFEVVNFPLEFNWR